MRGGIPGKQSGRSMTAAGAHRLKVLGSNVPKGQRRGPAARVCERRGIWIRGNIRSRSMSPTRGVSLQEHVRDVGQRREDEPPPEAVGLRRWTSYGLPPGAGGRPGSQPRAGVSHTHGSDLT